MLGSQVRRLRRRRDRASQHWLKLEKLAPMSCPKPPLMGPFLAAPDSPTLDLQRRRIRLYRRVPHAAVPFESLARLVVIPEIWYHYAAAVIRSRLLVGIAVALLLEAALVISLTFAGVATTLAILLGIILLQAIPIALILVFTVIGSRVNIGFLPVRDCPYFVSSVERIYPAV